MNRAHLAALVATGLAFASSPVVSGGSGVHLFSLSEPRRARAGRAQRKPWGGSVKKHARAMAKARNAR